jgi:hypothetical protein
MEIASSLGNDFYSDFYVDNFYLSCFFYEEMCSYFLNETQNAYFAAWLWQNSAKNLGKVEIVYLFTELLHVDKGCCKRAMHYGHFGQIDDRSWALAVA